jgi:hypothetical protein
MMSKQKNAPKPRVRTGLKASGPVLQHGTRVRVRVRTNVKASGPVLQHGVRVRVRTGLKAGDDPIPGAKFNHGIRIRQAN